MITIQSAQILTSAFSPAEIPDLKLPQVAMVGRSNVGKSTLINRLVGRKQLAKTSSTPGRTQAINFFEIAFKEEESKNNKLLLVDLPGYGYAKLSQAQRQMLQKLNFEYLSRQDQPRLICLLNDVRRMPQNEELILRDLAFSAGKHLLVVLTKLDKIKKSLQLKQQQQLANAFGLEPDDLLLSGAKTSLVPLWERIWQLLSY